MNFLLINVINNHKILECWELQYRRIVSHCNTRHSRRFPVNPEGRKKKLQTRSYSFCIKINQFHMRCNTSVYISFIVRVWFIFDGRSALNTTTTTPFSVKCVTVSLVVSTARQQLAWGRTAAAMKAERRLVELWKPSHHCHCHRHSSLSPSLWPLLPHTLHPQKADR